MDERQLKRALEEINVPESDENAKKRALNLAMAEFDDAQKEKAQEKQKKFQGIPFLSRLMGITNPNDRRKTMFSDKKRVYGGMATAMAVVLICGISVQQYTTGSYKEDQIKSAEFTVGSSTSDHNFSDIAANVTGSPGLFSRKEKKDINRQLAQRGRGNITSENEVAGRRDAQTQSADKKNRSNEYRTKGELAKRAPTAQNKPTQELFEYEADTDIATVAPTMPATAPAKTAIMQEGIVGGLAGNIIASEQNMIVMNDEIAPIDAYKDVGRDQFQDFEENQIKLVNEEPVSTFSVDVDTASYAFIRRQINNGVLPQKDAVRIEEMINYFDYDYKLPETKEQPFEPSVTVTPSPWKTGNQLVHIGIKGYDIDEKPRSNLVFLLDVSGSMNSSDKLPLLKNSMKLLLDSLEPEDTVGIVVYAGAAGTVLEPTAVKDKHKILQALERLSAGGSTAGAEGIRQAYQLAEGNFDDEAVNRVILATDGDFNVGITNREELKDFVERKRETGIFLSVLGFGQGNYNDHMMQELAQNGNGVAAYIDSLSEARKVLVDEATSTLFPIAKDVKIQVEFNPETVSEYRLVGYETRHLNREDFNNDAVDAGDIGAGHTVTAIYEITPVGATPTVDPLRYGETEPVEEKHAVTSDFGSEYAFLKIRYKLPKEDTSKLITTPIRADSEAHDTAAQEAGWATAVATFGQILKGGKHTGTMGYDDVIKLAQANKGADEFGYRAEFINMVRLAKSAAALQKN